VPAGRSVGLVRPGGHRRRVACLQMRLEGEAAGMPLVVDRGGPLHARRPGRLPRHVHGKVQIGDVPALLRWLIDDRRLAVEDLKRQVNALARRTAPSGQPVGEHRFHVAAVAGQFGGEPRLFDAQRADVRVIPEQVPERTVAREAVGLQDRFVLGVANLDAGNGSRREPADRRPAEGDRSIQHGRPAHAISHQRRMGDNRGQQADQQHQAQDQDGESREGAFSP